MPLSMHAASAPVFIQLLTALSGLLDKAEAHARARKIEPKVLLEQRLFPDMFAFVRQVQLTSDFAKGACARLAGVEVPVYDDNEQSFPELKARIARTIDFVKSLKPADFEGAETRDVTIRIAGKPVVMKGEPYLLHFALPNFYFHATTAYAILRHAGIELGKLDFVGTVPGLTLR
ncbi:MAG: DUF1993 domain-containing protein [Hyphomicrobiaceae bacterium]|jgi:hypothetical protein